MWKQSSFFEYIAHASLSLWQICRMLYLERDTSLPTIKPHRNDGIFLTLLPSLLLFFLLIIISKHLWHHWPCPATPPISFCLLNQWSEGCPKKMTYLKIFSMEDLPIITVCDIQFLPCTENSLVYCLFSMLYFNIYLLCLIMKCNICRVISWQIHYIVVNRKFVRLQANISS